MLMKLVRHDITETNHAGIDHRAMQFFMLLINIQLSYTKGGQKS